MTHEELLANINFQLKAAEFEDACGDGGHPPTHKALRAVVELHKPNKDNRCDMCTHIAVNAFPDVHTDTVQHLYPCPTIQAIEKELK